MSASNESLFWLLRCWLLMMNRRSVQPNNFSWCFIFLQSLLSDAWILIKVSNHHSSYCQTGYSCQAFLLKISCLVHNIRFKYFFIACRYFVLLSRIITKAIIFLDNVFSDLYPNVHSVHVGPVWNCLVVILRSVTR